MSDSLQSRLQQVIANRPKGDAGVAAAAAANPVDFQGWLFFGSAPNVFVQVGVLPTSSSVVLQYILVVLQTPQGFIFSNAAINAGGNPQGALNVNIATDTGLYDISQFGNQVQAWAYVQAYVGGQVQEQYSATQNYTVES